jgi:autotransporter-associated beta strand protein
MTNKEESARNFLYIAAKEKTADTVFRIGHLVTGTEDALAYTNSELRTYKDGLTLEVGALGKDGTFAANIRQYETKTSGTKTSLVKVGDGTWTLTGTNHVYGGTTTVQGGRLNIDSAEFTAGTAIIVTNAVLGGTGTIKVPITVKEHGALAGSFTATQGVTFEAGSCVEIAAEAENTPTFETDVDVANLTVKLTGELDTAQEYTILTAGSGSSGRAKVVVDKPSARGAWRTKLVAGDGGVKVLTAYFVKPGLTVIIR